jgi:hypothetical protein
MGLYFEVPYMIGADRSQLKPLLANRRKLTILPNCKTLLKH